MNHTTYRNCIVGGALAFVSVATTLAAEAEGQAQACRQRVQVVTGLKGCVAFWDFVKREPDGQQRFTAHVPPGATNDFPLDAGNYIKDFWGAGREATYADFALLGRGPFGNAIRIVKETDPNFRPFLFVPRQRLHDTSLDIKGAGKSVTVVVWAIRESGNHALAGIWHEGTDLQEKATNSIQKVQRGQRQYALFAGLNKEGSACGHLSESGASSFLNKYALHKCNSAAQSPAVPADSPAEVLDASWQCFAMTFDHERDELTGWLNGISGDRWLEHPQKDGLLSFAANAWLQGRLHREPGLQPGEDPKFPPDQFYNPPEEKPVVVAVVSETADERVELREYGYTKVKVTLRKAADGTFHETSRDLMALRLNPWWYPHDLYAPPNDGSGGPFTIGRVIHSSRSVGFTGWIGGVAVFNRALSAEELAALAALRDVRGNAAADLSRVPQSPSAGGPGFSLLGQVKPRSAKEIAAPQPAPKPRPKPQLQYESGDIRISMPTADEPRVKSFGAASIRAAAKYLDEGAVAWMRDKSCVACHTPGAYMLGRPLLTKQLGKPNAEVLAEFIKGIQDKLPATKEKDGVTYYVLAERAVWRAAGLAQWDKHVTGKTSADTDRALRSMLLQLSSHGGFYMPDHVEIPYETTDLELSQHAARAIVEAPGWLANLKDPDLLQRIERLKAFLREVQPRHDYDRVLRIGIASFLPEVVPHEDRDRDMAMLWAKQHADGGWSTRDMSETHNWSPHMTDIVIQLIESQPDSAQPESDPFMTALAICLLRESGTPANDPRIQKAIAWLKHEQRESGRWWMQSLYRGNYQYSTYIATAKALQALALCGQIPKMDAK